MKIRKAKHNGFTRIELLVVIVIFALLITGSITNLFGYSRKKHVSYCKYNFIQTYRALTAFKDDSQNRFPWHVPEQDGGSIEYIANSKKLYTYKHWLSLAKYLEHPKILRCPEDRNRPRTNSWLENKPLGGAGKDVVPFSGNSAFSYFIATEAKPDVPEYIISGDRNMFFGKYSNDRDKMGSIENLGKIFTSQKQPLWSQSLHSSKGILLKGDGNIFFISSQELGNELKNSENEKNRFHFPRGI